MAHLHTTRSRPDPLSLHHSNSTFRTPLNGSNQNERARLLSSLRSAPVPQEYNHQYQAQQQYANGMTQPQIDPRSAAYAQFQNAQTAYLAELQRQILVKQNEIWLNQQHMEAEAALRAMSLQQEQLAGQREWEVEQRMAQERQQQAEMEQARNNPLMASALARRKRQSLNLEAQQRESLAASIRERSYSRERHATPPASASPSSSSSVRSTPPPPALILSAPGEPYPDTSSSASGSDSGETRPSSPASTLDSSPKLDDARDHLDREMKASRRRSHLDTLSNALSSRQKRRPASIGGPPPSSQVYHSSPSNSDVTTPRPSQLSFSTSPSLSQHRSPQSQHHARFTPRSVSDSASHSALRSPSANSPSTFPSSHPRSPRVSTSSPRFSNTSSPNSSPNPDTHYVSHKPTLLPGHAMTIRQPRGPPVTLGDENFSTRIRQKVVGDLVALTSSSIKRRTATTMNDGQGEIGVAC